MATSRSAKKRHRQSLARRTRNRAVRTHVRTAVKKALAAITEKGDAAAAVREAQRTLDRAAGKGVIHRKTASRRASRLARRAHQVVSAKKA